MENYITEEVFRSTMDYYMQEIVKLNNDNLALQTKLNNVSKQLHDIIYAVEGPLMGRMNDLEDLHVRELNLQYTIDILAREGDILY